MMWSEEHAGQDCVVSGKSFIFYLILPMKTLNDLLQSHHWISFMFLKDHCDCKNGNQKIIETFTINLIKLIAARLGIMTEEEEKEVNCFPTHIKMS